MKKNFIGIFCCLLLLLTSCRKKSKLEKQREKFTKEQMAKNR
jgi:hypothetical protein